MLPSDLVRHLSGPVGPKGNSKREAHTWQVNFYQACQLLKSDAFANAFGAYPTFFQIDRAESKSKGEANSLQINASKTYYLWSGGAFGAHPTSFRTDRAERQVE